VPPLPSKNWKPRRTVGNGKLIARHSKSQSLRRNNRPFCTMFLPRMILRRKSFRCNGCPILMSGRASTNPRPEEIETEDQLRKLQDLDCNIGQGYFFSRPPAPR